MLPTKAQTTQPHNPHHNHHSTATSAPQALAAMGLPPHSSNISRMLWARRSDTPAPLAVAIRVLAAGSEGVDRVLELRSRRLEAEAGHANGGRDAVARPAPGSRCMAVRTSRIRAARLRRSSRTAIRCRTDTPQCAAAHTQTMPVRTQRAGTMSTSSSKPLLQASSAETLVACLERP